MISTSTKILLGLLAVLLVGFILLPSWLKWVLIVVVIIAVVASQLYSDKVEYIKNKVKQDVKKDFEKTKTMVAKSPSTM